MIRFDQTTAQFVNDLAADDNIKTREQAVAFMSNEMLMASGFFRAKFVGPVSPFEAAGWAPKLEEAKAGGGPLLTLEAQVRGVTLEQMVARVLANAQAFSQMEAQLSGLTGRHRDAVAALPTREEVLAYDWRAGWPV